VESVKADTVQLTIILVFFNIVFFFLYKTFSGVLRFSSFSDLLKIVYALSLGYALSFLSVKIIQSQGGLPHITDVFFFASYALNVMLMTFSRIFAKEMFDVFFGHKGKSVNVFVYGTKGSGISVAKALREERTFDYRLKGFITDEEYMIGKHLLGVKVYPNDENLFRAMEEKMVKTVIISPRKMEEIKNSPFLVRFIDNNISLLTTAPMSEWDGKLTRKEQLKDVQIEDLLSRDPIHINTKGIASHIEGKRIMITGAAGSIGSEIVKQVASFNPYSIILIDQAETPLHDIRLEMHDRWCNIRTEIVVADITNASRMEKIFAETQPQYIFHAAAYKHVPMMEDNVSESIQNNVLGTKILADLAIKYNVYKFVMISTDKAVNPSNVMGCSKRICEIYVQALAMHYGRIAKKTTQFITTRFGNVLGSNGSVIPLFKEQIKNGGPITVTHPEIIRYFMLISEACQLVLEAGSMGRGGEIYIFDMGEPVKILDLAKRMILLSGSKDIKIEFSGLRHGEKLYEELLNNAEQTKPTHHEKIMIANVREYEYGEVKALIDDLIETSYVYDDKLTVMKMKRLVPEFHSTNSPFEEIDKEMEDLSFNVSSRSQNGGEERDERLCR
jgi:FlaA1/EpsC-like NDP-sugar epimerase